MNLLTVLQIVSALVPLVKDAVQAAEQVFGPTKGADKLNDAVARVEGALPKVAAIAGNVEAARAAIRPLIEATVAAANASGAFRKRKRRKK